MAAEAGGDIRAGIGTRLRAAREKKSLTILQAAEKLHVDARILESLEAEDFAALGAPVYARGHLRHYAELVGESPAELQQIYADSTKSAPAQPDLTRIARAAPVADSGKLVGPAVIGLVAVGVIGVVWWVFTLSGADTVRPTAMHGKLESNAAGSQAGPGAGAGHANPTAADADAADDTPPLLPEPAPESTPRGASAAAKPNAKSVAANGNGAGNSGAQSGGKSTTGTATAGTKGAPPPATKLATATNASSPSAAKNSAATNAGSASAAKNSAGSASPASIAATAAGGTAAAPIPVANVAVPPPAAHTKDGELTLKFSSDSWAEVYDATGQRLFYDVGAAASAHTMRGPAPLRVILGNASGVAVEFNGRPAMIPAGVQADGSTRFVINAHGRTVPASPASDGD